MDDLHTGLVPQRELTPPIWQMFNQMAPVLYQSRLFGVSSREQAAAIMLKGWELGLSISASFEFVQIIQGKPSLSPRGALALLHSNPLIEQIIIQRIPAEGPFVGYECAMRRRGGFEHRARYTLADAQRAGLVKPGSGWEHYPENMCLWRAVGFAADVVAPDLTAGMTGLMKMPEQFSVGLTAEGDVVEGTWTVTSPETHAQTSAGGPVAPALPEPQQVITLDDLLTTYTAEQILVANEGRIPGTDQEVAAVAHKLAGAG